EALAVSKAAAELRGHAAKSIVAHLLEARLERVDFADGLVLGLDLAVVRRPENATGDGLQAEHQCLTPRGRHGKNYRKAAGIVPPRKRWGRREIRTAPPLVNSSA